MKIFGESTKFYFHILPLTALSGTIPLENFRKHRILMKKSPLRSKKKKKKKKKKKNKQGRPQQNV